MSNKDNNKTPHGAEHLAKHCFKKGNTLGGRTKGSKNRKTLRQELASKGGLTPAEFLHSIMNDEDANLNQRQAAANKLIEFTESKLQSLSVDANVILDPVFNFSVDLEEDGEESLEACTVCEEDVCSCELPK